MPSKTTTADNYQNNNEQRNKVLALKLLGAWADLEITNIERKPKASDPEKGYWKATYE